MSRAVILPLLKMTIILTFFLYFDVSAQKQETDAYFLALRNNQPATPVSFTSKTENGYLKPLSAYLHDTVPSIRAEAYYLLSRLGQHAQQKNLRKKVVNLLIGGWLDTDKGINNMVDNTLTRFQPADFDRVALDSIKSRLRKLPSSPGRLFKLVGYLQLHDQVPKIKTYVEDQQPL